MEPHELRVIEEKHELDGKLERLVAFIASSPRFKELDSFDQFLLCHQRGLMLQYSDILARRIQRFGT